MLKQKRREGFGFLYFDGGEPTLRKDLSAICAGALRLGYRRITINTNATLLGDGKFITALSRLPGAKKNILFCVSLHSHKPAVSDRLTGFKGSLGKTLAGLARIKEAGFTFSIYHLITAYNYRDLPGFSRFAADNYPQMLDVNFSFIFPSGSALENKDIYPEISRVAPYFDKAVALLVERNINVNLISCGLVPLCMLKGLEKLFINSYEAENASNSQVADSEKTEDFPFHSSDEILNRKIKPAKCSSCVVTQICGGLWHIYADRYGLAEIKPFRRVPPGAKRTGAEKIMATPEDKLQNILVSVYKARLYGAQRFVFSPGVRKRADFFAVTNFARSLLGIRKNQKRKPPRK